MPLAMDCVPNLCQYHSSGGYGRGKLLTIRNSHVVSTRMVISTDGQQSAVRPAVLDEPRRRLLGRLEPVHDADPEIDHGPRLGPRAEVAHVLVQGDVVVLLAEAIRLHGLCLDAVPDLLKRLLFGKLRPR